MSFATLAPAFVSAQDVSSAPVHEEVHAAGRPALTATEHRHALEEEASIDWESRHATALYIASAVLFFGGLGAGIGGWVLSDPGLGSFTSSPPLRDDATSAELAGWTLLGVAGAMVFSSLFTFGFAVTFDGSSGSRRADLERRREALPTARLTIGPLDRGGVLVGMAGRF